MHTSTAILFICLLVHASADFSQEDCQPNEVFVKCGQCEGTCANHRPVCDRKCRGVRCECIAARGFVRSEHGHCIRIADCPGTSIYSQDPFFSRRSNTHISRNSKRNQMDRNVDPTRNFRRPSHEHLNLNRKQSFFPVELVHAADWDDALPSSMNAPAKMRIWIVSLLIAFPSQINAECDCSDVEKELEEERRADEFYHGCRACRTPVIAADSCPKFGFDCDATLPLRNSAITQTFAQYQVSCNDREWTVGNETTDSVICAKPCNPGLCKASHPQPSPPADFVPLQVSPATETNEQQCAIAGCEPNLTHAMATNAFLENVRNSDLLVALHPDGTKAEELVATSVTCTGDGKWKDDKGSYEFVMCNALPTLKCAVLTGDWDPNQCAATSNNCGQQYKCTAGTGSTTAYTCAAGTQPIILGSEEFIKLDSITCDTTKGVWVYKQGTLVLDQANLDLQIGTGSKQYSCIGTDGPASLKCSPLTGGASAWDTNECGAVLSRTCQQAPINDCAFTCSNDYVPALKYTSGVVTKEMVFETAGVTCTSTGWKFTYKDELTLSHTVDMGQLMTGPAQPWSWACASKTLEG